MTKRNLFNLKNDLNQIYLLKEEIDLFNSIDPNLIEEFKKIVIKINKRDIGFKIFKTGMDDKYLLSFTDNNCNNFYPLNYKNMWSNFNFFKNYFLFSDYNYDPKVFQKIHLHLKRYSILGRFNKIIYFLPFYLIKPNKKNKEFIYRFFPKVKIKDYAFVGKKHFMGFYCWHYEKSQYIKTNINKVISFLSDNDSKKNYDILLNGKVDQNWFNFFNKAHKNFVYSDYIKLDENSVIINCGVADAPELKLFNNVKEIYNIDPGKDKYLEETVKYILNKTKTKNYFLNYALYTDKTVYNFEERNIKPKVKTLKEIISEHKINKISLIKTDLEGTERYMVDDLIEICDKYKPQLAISIYHTNHERGEDEKLFDLVDIPLRIMNKLHNKYNFYFNTYCYERWEAIVYCIPK